MADPMCGEANEVLKQIASMPRSVRKKAPGETTPPAPVGESGFPDLIDVREKLDEIDVAAIASEFTRPPNTIGRRPYPRGPMIRALLSMPVLGITNLSALHKRLMNDPALRSVCGFTTRVPSRPTFSRIFGQLSERPELLETCLANVAAKLAEYVPDIGREVAVDSTMIRTNSNPKPLLYSDPEASRGKQHSAQAERGWKWVLGYKAHVAADANNDIPLEVLVTTGSVSDTKYLITLVDMLKRRPEVVIADRGYDSNNNNRWLNEQGFSPVIHKRKPKNGYHTGKKGQKYSTKGTPLCECGHERPYIGPDIHTGERVYGPVSDCTRGGKLTGFSMCDVEVRVNPDDDIRLFGGQIARDSRKWNRTYRKRWSVERVFSRWKERAVLENHSFRGLSKVRLLVQLYAVAYVAARLVEVKDAAALPMAA
ncbi:MAG: transposase [Dehalococcoidia bacterium]|nr:transposase [Dehalococcoidia bacterium]